MEDIRLAMIRQVERELAELEAVDAAVERGLRPRRRDRGGSSVVFSLRLDPGERDALERRAAMLGVKPSVLARNLVRQGLRGSPDEYDMGATIDRLEAAIEDLRAMRGQ